MANRKKTVEIDFIADTSKATRGIKDVGDTAEKTGNRFQRMSSGMKVAAVAAAGFVATKVADFLGDAARAAAEDEASQKQLALALQNTTGATDAQVEAVEAWIDGMARSRGVADDELRPALANLVRASGDVAKAQDDLGVAMDISAARGIDLNTVTLAMSKAQLGNVGALGRLGIATKNAAGETLTYDEVLKEASRTMGGAAMEASQTLEGRLKRQQVAWEETKETVGTQVIPILAKAGDTLAFYLAKAAGTTEHSITTLSLAFNDLVNAGIDPTLDPMRSLVAVLVESEKHVATNSESLDVLIGMLDLEGQSLATASQYLREHGTELGLNEVQVKNLITQLNLEDQAARDAARGLGVGRGALEENTAATYANIDAIKELVDPLFGVINAEERLSEATQAYTTELAKNGPHTKKAEELALALVKAQLDANSAAARYGEEGGPASVNALVDLAREAGISEQEIRRMIAAINDANNTPVRVPRRRSNLPGGPGGITEFHSGGTVQGAFRGQAVPVIARAGEHISQGGRPAHNGHGGGVTVIVQGSVISERELIETVREAMIRGNRGGRPWS